MIGFVEGGGDVFVPGKKWSEEEVKAFLRAQLGTDFTKPCSECGVMPEEGDLWRVEKIGDRIREGHSECLEGK